MVAAIAGPQEPYVVRWRTPSTTDTSCGAVSCPWPQIAHSCMAADGSLADPAVRIAELVGNFGVNGRLNRSVTTTSRPPWTTSPPTSSGTSTRHAYQGGIAKRPGTTSDDCTVVDSDTGKGVASCDDTGGAGECWHVVAGGTSCTGVSVVVQANPQGTGNPPGTLTVKCTMCVPGIPDAEVGCP